MSTKTLKRIAKGSASVLDAGSSVARSSTKTSKKALKSGLGSGSSIMSRFKRTASSAASSASTAVKRGSSGVTSAAKKASDVASKAAGACKRNPKMCAAGVLGAGTAAYAAKKYIDMTEDQKDCMNMCFPEDWAKYVDGQIDKPNYKVVDGASLDDSSIKYAPLYDDLEVSSRLCTPDSLRKYDIPEGTDSCNIFCESACDFDISDVVQEVVSDGTKAVADGTKEVVKAGSNAAADVGGSAFQGLMDGLGIDLKQAKKYLIIGVIVILLLFVLSFFL